MAAIADDDSNASNNSWKPVDMAKKSCCGTGPCPGNIRRAAPPPGEIFGCIMGAESLEEVGHGGEYGAQARPQSATAETGGGAEAAGRSTRRWPARSRAKGGGGADPALPAQPGPVRTRHWDDDSGARRYAPSSRDRRLSARRVLSGHQGYDV